MVEVTIKDRIAVLTLNRPEKRNALDDKMAAEILRVLNDLSNDPECKVLIIKGKGEAFCAGADLGYLQTLQKNSYEQNLQDSMSLMSMFKALNDFPKVTIAQVEGPALAGGCGLAGICDFCFATPAAKFGYTEVKIGFIPAIVSVFLSSKIGENKAKSMLLTGNIYNSEESKNLGIINDVIAENKIEEYVMHFAMQICKGVSSQSIELTKKLLNDIKGFELDEQLEMAAQANAGARSTQDCKKGISSFLNKEKISW